MKKLTGKTGLFILACLLIIFTFNSCEKTEEATRTRMQGNWELTYAADAAGNDIKQKVAFPVTVLQLTDDNGMIGTLSPMFMYIVYGDSKWVQIAGEIDQVFDYANFRFNTGEFFVDPAVQDHFTVEAKLQATALAGGLTDILTLAGVDATWFQQVIYHKFVNVSVSFADDDHMTWEFTNATQPFYNYKDGQGNYVTWGGIPVNNFTRGTFAFTRRTQTLNEIVDENK
jgi:hypothetical protein